ncbi:DUF4097 domain-containing protein [Radiobacillus kanasensis]|uniref:DUF4097 family beta strand repeat-containing protein n=1 Tax=Radiobacillus kanasensis TaxID=2844358 RepID=UPI001E53210C|nr:DUF4097 family beta strand repeat-containing protein [Radiobacillus kanasensis]UFT99035.1 DUF4097 domain-containing protein [Radiobacillus kanasensis]
MKKVALIAFIVFVLGIVGVLTTYASGDHFLTGGNSHDITESKSFAAENVQHLSVKVDVGEVKVKRSNSDEIEVSIRASEQRKGQIEYSIDKKEDVVEVVFNKDDSPWYSFPNISFGDHGSVVEIKLPDKEFESLAIESDVGEVDVHQVKAREFTATSDVGDIKVDQVVADTSTLSSDVGEIEVNGGTGAFHIESDTGDVSLELNALEEDVHIESSVGEVSVSLINEPKNFTFDLASDVGGVSVEGFSSIQKSSGRSYYVEQGNGNSLLQVKADVGEVQVEKN